mmetsp:Transcript_89275/g.261008  ORF Transcript_89275/g.261008 Transcript_89275/m.261008 type:complete len:287 (+) Transcript_89275:360-1220(+)
MSCGTYSRSALAARTSSSAARAACRVCRSMPGHRLEGARLAARRVALARPAGIRTLHRAVPHAQHRPARHVHLPAPRGPGVPAEEPAEHRVGVVDYRAPRVLQAGLVAPPQRGAERLQAALEGAPAAAAKEVLLRELHSCAVNLQHRREAAELHDQADQIREERETDLTPDANLHGTDVYVVEDILLRCWMSATCKVERDSCSRECNVQLQTQRPWFHCLAQLFHEPNQLFKDMEFHVPHLHRGITNHRVSPGNILPNNMKAEGALSNGGKHDLWPWLVNIHLDTH